MRSEGGAARSLIERTELLLHETAELITGNFASALDGAGRRGGRSEGRTDRDRTGHEQVGFR